MTVQKCHKSQQRHNGFKAGLLVFKTLSDNGSNIGSGAEGFTGTVGNNQAGPPNPNPQGPIQ